MKKIIISFISLLLFLSCLDNIFFPLIITGQVTDVDSLGAVFHAKVTDLGDKDVVEFGFVWDTNKNPTFENSEKYIFPGKATIANYSAKISSGLEKDKKYFVRAFIRNEDVVTYGEETSFFSMGGKKPEILYISPVIGNLRDTIVIVGKYFSSKSSQVNINEISTEIIKVNQDSILAIVPFGLGKKTSAVSIKTLNQIVIAKDSFTLISPVINNFESKNATYGDEITITGKNFSENPASLRVYFDNILSDSHVVDDMTIKATVPDELDNAKSTITIIMNNQSVKSVENFSLLPVEITDFNPKIVLTGGTITINGKYFNPILKRNRVYIGGVLAKPISVTENTLEVKLPLQDTVVYSDRNATVSVVADENTSTLNDKLLINDIWFRRANAPSELFTKYDICANCTPFYHNYKANCFVVGKKAYIGLHGKKIFWCYDTEKNTWHKLMDFPGPPRTDGSGFVFEDKIYFGTGMLNYNTGISDWWEYDTTTDSWTQKKNLSVPLYTSFGFNNDKGCFLHGGYTYSYNQSSKTFTYILKVWKYNPQNDTWNYQTLGNWIDNTSSGMDFWTPCKALGNIVYVNIGLRMNSRSTNKMYIVDSSNATMNRIADYPTNLDTEAVSFYINGNVFIRKKVVDQNNKPFYYYDKENNVWKYVRTELYTPLSYGIAFEIDNIGFTGLGESNHLYEYDPNR